MLGKIFNVVLSRTSDDGPQVVDVMTTNDVTTDQDAWPRPRMHDFSSLFQTAWRWRYGRLPPSSCDGGTGTAIFLEDLIQIDDP